jgi:hypothetical protein
LLERTTIARPGSSRSTASCAGHRDLITHLQVLLLGDYPVGVADIDAEPALDPVIGVRAAAPAIARPALTHLTCTPHLRFDRNWRSQRT